MKTLQSPDPLSLRAPLPAGQRIPGDFTKGVLSRLIVRQTRRDVTEASCLVAELCETALDDGPGRARAMFDRLLGAGMGAERLRGDLIPAAARRLGQMWTEDQLSFAAVTHATAQLQSLIRHLGEHPRLARVAPGGAGHGIMLALCPGETHALGLIIVADEFRANGWRVELCLSGDATRLADRAEAGMYDLIGISASTRARIPALSATVAALREAARPGTPIVIGGLITTEEPGIAPLVGADLAARSAGTVMDIFRDSLVLP